MKYRVYIEFDGRSYIENNCGEGFSYEEAEAWAEGLRILDEKGITNYHLTVIRIEEMGA